MARNEQHREDLIAEAIALVDRMEVRCPPVTDGSESIVIAGFRSSGFFSIYFGQNLHYQFDTESRLRRAFIEPCLYRAQYGTLTRLERQRSTDRTILQRVDLSSEQTGEVLANCHQHLRQLLSGWQANECEVLRFVLANEEQTATDLRDRILRSIRLVLTRTDDFLSNTIKGKRLK